MNPALAYLWDGFTLTCRELAFLLGPGLVFGVVLHYLAELIRHSFLKLMGVGAFAWITAPGTVIHELGHVVFCLLFGHEVRDLALFRPRDKQALGHVKHAYNPRNPYHMMGHFFIGTGPIWVGAAVLYGLSALLGRTVPVGSVETGLSWDGFAPLLGRIGLSGTGSFLSLFDAALFRDWPVYVFLYLGISIGAHMTLSLEDLAGALKGFAVLLVLVLLLNWGSGWIEGGSESVALWLLRPFSAMYGVMVFAILLVAALTLPLALLATLAGNHEPKGGKE